MNVYSIWERARVCTIHRRVEDVEDSQLYTVRVRTEWLVRKWECIWMASLRHTQECVLYIVRWKFTRSCDCGGCAKLKRCTYMFARAYHMRRSPVRIRVHGFAGAHTYTRAYSRRSNPHSSYRSSQFSISDGRAVLSNSVKFLEIDNWIGTESIFEWARESRLI